MTRRLLAAGVSVALLALIYATLDVTALAGAIAGADPLLLAVAGALLLPPLLVSAWRLDWLAPPESRPGPARAFKVLMLACTLNLALPSKLGDLLKAGFLRRPEQPGLAAPLMLVVFEKGWDVLGLVACGLAAALLAPAGTVPGWTVWLLAGLSACGVAGLGSRRLPALLLRPVGRVLRGDAESLAAPWRATQDRAYATPGRALLLAVCSMAIWALQLLQVWAMARALHLPLPLLPGMALLTVGMLAGLLPFTFAGIGTRDAAFVVLLAPFADPATAAALGVLFVGRLVAPALVGLMFMPGEAGALAAFRMRPAAEAGRS